MHRLSHPQARRARHPQGGPTPGDRQVARGGMENWGATTVPTPDSKSARLPGGHQPAVREARADAMARRRHRRRVLDLLPTERPRRGRISRRRERQTGTTRQENKQHEQLHIAAGHGTVRAQRRVLPPPRSHARRLRQRAGTMRGATRRNLSELAQTRRLERRVRRRPGPERIRTTAGALTRHLRASTSAFDGTSTR